MTHIVTVVGARPQFIKAATVSRAIAAHNDRRPDAPLRETIIHTGQHYDANMSQVFFDELRIPAPRHHLGVGGGGHGEQTGLMLQKLEPVLLAEAPDVVLLYGDTNSTLAGAVAASKLHIRIAHVEAGLRSFNRRMPEEINRIVADRLSDLLFCPTDTAVKNLAAEGMRAGVHRVGDVMFDSVRFYAAAAEGGSRVLEGLGLKPKGYYLATVHRAENTDDAERLAAIFDAFARLPHPVVLPVHPRTRKMLARCGDGLPDEAAESAGEATRVIIGTGGARRRVPIPVRRPPGAGGGEPEFANVRMVEPQPYLETLALQRHARAVLTDSGGVQKEAYFAGVPCITLRDETEWVELVEVGANQVVGADTERIIEAARRCETTPPPDPSGRLYGDGHSADQIVEILAAG